MPGDGWDAVWPIFEKLGMKSGNGSNLGFCLKDIAISYISFLKRVGPS